MTELILKTPAWLAWSGGRDDGLDGVPARPEHHEAPERYMRGYERGCNDRESMDDFVGGDAA